MKRLSRLFSEGRLRAAFLCVLVLFAPLYLSGCADARRNSPFVSTFAAFLPGGAGDVGKQAAAIPYASIDISIGRAGGLLVLAEKTDDLTFWQSSTRETIVFNQGYLESTQGLSSNLLYSRMGDVGSGANAPWQKALDDGVSVLNYPVERGWRDAKGKTHAAAGQAGFVCAETPESKKLPLTTIELTRCVETVDWASGAQTRSVVWRDPATRRIWAGDIAAWPGGLRVSWNVARPWW